MIGAAEALLSLNLRFEADEYVELKPPYFIYASGWLEGAVVFIDD